MSGHSKWANIKNRKGAQDKKRSEAFTKISKAILTAIREGGGNTNPESNYHLKAVIEKAREANMPKENIWRVLSNFDLKKANLVTCIFEGFGPLGVPMVVEAETDNKNRTIAEMRNVFKNHGGSLGEGGSVMYQFKKVGEVELEEEVGEDKQLELIDSGAEEIKENFIWGDEADLGKMGDKARSLGLKVKRTEVVLRAQTPIKLSTEGELEQIMDLIDELEDNEEVIRVFAGFDYSE